MWKRDDSDWAKEKNQIRYEYMVDDDVCTYCRSRQPEDRKQDCKIKTFRNEILERDQSYCSASRGRSKLEIITLFKDSEYIRMNMFAGDVWKYRTLGETDKIDIHIQRNNKTGSISWSMLGCDYDNSSSLDLKPTKVAEIINSIPLFNDGDVPNDPNLKLDLNIIGGSKEEWLDRKSVG